MAIFCQRWRKDTGIIAKQLEVKGMTEKNRTAIDGGMNLLVRLYPEEIQS